MHAAAVRGDGGPVSSINARSFTLDEIIRAALESRLADVRVAMPAAVVSYRAANQTATMRPLLKGTAADPSGIDTTPTLPDIYGVPVLFVGGGGARATFPVAAGDMALLVFADRALDRWKSSGAGSPAAAQDPGANNQHSLADAVAIVGLHAPGIPWTSAPTDRATFGFDALGPRLEVLAGGVAAVQGAGLGNALRTELDALWSALGGHTHSVPIVGPVGVTPTSTPAPAVVKTAQTVESATVKVTP